MSKLTSEERDKMPASDFVFPKTREYPIRDENHAQIAIKDATGTPQESAVRAAVRRKFPQIHQGGAADSGMRG